MEILAIIPARGGSKGIPRKNLRLLAGKPLLTHTIQQALDCPQITRTVVSTDDVEIANVARQAGAGVVMRPAEISGDTASSESALEHALGELKRTESYEPEQVVFLQCTSPLRPAGELSRALAEFITQGADSLVSVVPFHGFRWARRQGLGQPLNYDPISRPRRQELNEEFLENGSIYVFKTKLLRKTRSRLGGRIALFPMGPFSSVDIDCEADLQLCEAILARGLI